MENKKSICENTGRLLAMTRLGENIESIDYLRAAGEEYAVVQIKRTANTSDAYKICISADSGAAIIKDIIKFMESAR